MYAITDINDLYCQIWIETDYIINADKSNYSQDNIRNFVNEIIKTDTGIYRF